MQFSELLFADGRRRRAHQIDRLGRLGEGDHLTDRLLAGQKHDDPVQSQRDAAMRRSAVAECLQQEAESLFRFLTLDAQGIENLALYVLAMNTDRTPSDLDSVEDDVVGLGQDLGGVAREELEILIARRREGMMQRDEPLLFIIPFEQGKVVDPQEVKPVRWNQVQTSRQMLPES